MTSLVGFIMLVDSESKIGVDMDLYKEIGVEERVRLVIIRRNYAT